MSPDPPLHVFKKRRRFASHFSGLSVCGYGRLVVVDGISLAPAHLKEIERTASRWAERQARRVERQPVMALCAREPVSRAGDRHLGRLQRCVVGGSEPSI